MAGQNVKSFNDLNFEEEVIQSEVPVFVDFSATWCGPCKQIAPLIDQLADQYDGQIKVGKVDIDESPATAQRFGIRGVPTLYMFKGGELIAQQVGAVPKSKMEALISQAL